MFLPHTGAALSTILQHVANWHDPGATLRAGADGEPYRLNLKPDLIMEFAYEFRKVVELASDPIQLGVAGLEHDPMRCCPLCADVPAPAEASGPPAAESGGPPVAEAGGQGTSSPHLHWRCWTSRHLAEHIGACLPACPPTTASPPDRTTPPCPHLCLPCRKPCAAPS